MNELCSNCGAELFEGQQFCRRCGAPTRKLSAEQMPTQIFPSDRQTAQPPPQQQTAQRPFAATTPLSGADTGGIYHSTFAAQYQPPAGVPAALPTETARLQRRKSHRLRNWLIAVLCFVVLFGA